MPETHSAVGGWAASLEADAQSEKWDGREHRLAATYRHPDFYGVCTCGERIDAVDVRQLDRLLVEHRRQALAGDQQDGLARARASLAEAVERKGAAS